MEEPFILQLCEYVNIIRQKLLESQCANQLQTFSNNKNSEASNMFYRDSPYKETCQTEDTDRLDELL